MQLRVLSVSHEGLGSSTDHHRDQRLPSRSSRAMVDRELFGECVLCGEQVWSDDDPAEMHDAKMLADPEMYSEARGGICHAQCGLDEGWEIS